MLRHDNLCKTNNDLKAMLSVATNSNVVTGLVQPAVDPNDRYKAGPYLEGRFGGSNPS